MSLPSSWVERIFTKLTLIYGRRFLDQWAGLEIEAVKEDWAHELSGLQQSPKAITYALQNLPEGKPPTVLEFRAIARKMPGEVVRALPLERLDTDIVAGFIAKARAITPKSAPGNKDWAHTIIRRHEAGDNIRPICLKFAREALAPRSNLPVAA